jgi:peptidoglycan/LPS O-acetylase OafA/YrhL
MSPRQQRALTALGFFGIGMLLTFASMQLAKVSDVMSSVLLVIWLPVVFGGTQILPNSITVPYDPVGHPGLYILAFLINAAIYGAVAYGLWRLIKWTIQRLSQPAT